MNKIDKLKLIIEAQKEHCLFEINKHRKSFIDNGDCAATFTIQHRYLLGYRDAYSSILDALEKINND